MILKRFYNEKLAQASYLVGCPGSGEAVVIDPLRDPELYLQAAADEGLRITVVTETHIHADYLSGSRELAQLAGARLVLSDEGGPDWTYAFTGDIQLVKNGDSFRVGAVRFDIVHTPGHTPEHISFLMTDEAASAEPQAIFTGDLVFVGDVGRPDLLEQAAGITGTQEPGARKLYQTIQNFKSLPDHVMVWPAHGAGSACGKSLGGVPVSTVGYEKASNWGFKINEEQIFVDEVLTGQPEPPAYFAMMKRLNKVGPDLLGGKPTPVRTSDPRVLTRPDTVVLDVRPSADYLENHLQASVHAPVKALGFTTWAGWFVPYDQDIVILAANEQDARQAAYDLALIGLDRVAAWAGPEILASAKANGAHIVRTVSRRADEIDFKGSAVLDVRGQTEWEQGHVPCATHVPLGYIPRRLADAPNDATLVVHCKSGGRSPVAVSVLERLGYQDIVNVTDGYNGVADLGPAVCERTSSLSL